MCISGVIFFVFKQKTAYEMRISDWSSDVGSSDLADQTSTILPGAGTLVATSEGGSAVGAENARGGDAAGGDIVVEVDGGAIVEADQLLAYALATGGEIGRASCRERVCQYV